MKRGFLFSMLIAVMLGLFMLVAQYYILERPTTSVFPGIVGSKENVAYSVASDLKTEMPVTIVRNGHILIEENKPNENTAAKILQWSMLAEKYEDVTTQNSSMDITNYTKISDFWVAGEGIEYKWTGDIFVLNHSGNYLLVNNTMGEVNTTDCVLDVAGNVETRIIIERYDSGVKYTSPGTEYGCFINFTDGNNVTISIDNASQLSIDYSNASNNFTQRVSFAGPEKMYVVFDRYNGITGSNPGWNESFAGDKTYATLAGMNFVLADEDTDGDYDYAFVDTDANGDFNDSNDRWYVKEGIVALNEKVFYMRFDLAGNWITIYNTLGTRSVSAWKGVWV